MPGKRTRLPAIVTLEVPGELAVQLRRLCLKEAAQHYQSAADHGGQYAVDEGASWAALANALCKAIPEDG